MLDDAVEFRTKGIDEDDSVSIMSMVCERDTYLYPFPTDEPDFRTMAIDNSIDVKKTICGYVTVENVDK
jgi:hypothetical protein